MTIGHGPTQTHCIPAIAWYGIGDFIIAYTGEDNRLYYSFFNLDLTLALTWGGDSPTIQDWGHLPLRILRGPGGGRGGT